MIGLPEFRSEICFPKNAAGNRTLERKAPRVTPYKGDYSTKRAPAPPDDAPRCRAHCLSASSSTGGIGPGVCSSHGAVAPSSAPLDRNGKASGSSAAVVGALIAGLL